MQTLSRFQTILIICSVLFLYSCRKKQPDRELRPNIILIMADDLGYGGLSSYGNKQYDTPNIDYLAENGITFTDFHANAPVCTPTRAALVTGRYQQRNGLEGVIYVQGKTRQTGLSPDEITIAELLGQAGYRTGIMGKWHLGYKQKYNPAHQGFDEFYGFVSGNIDYHSHYDNSGIYDWWHNTDSLYEEGYATDLITRHAVDFIRENKDRPFFLYVAHAAPHVPFQGRSDSAYRFPDKEFSYYGPVKDRQATYAEMVQVMDEGVGDILDALQAETLQSNTLIIFCSDNGGLDPYADNGQLRGSKTSLWEGGHRVPAIAFWPGRIEQGISDETVMSFDFFPTILEVADVAVPKNLKLDGVNLSPVLFGGEGLPDRDLFWRYRDQLAMRRNRWKLMIDKEDTLLFDLHKDIAEQNNIKDQHPALVEELLSALRRWEQEVLEGVILRTE